MNNLYKPKPLSSEQINFISPEQIGDDVLGVPSDIEQLREDAINVLEGRIDILKLNEDYQKKIKDYYRFSATRYGSKYGTVAKRTRSTLDIV